jgi:N-acetyltransferase
MELRTTRIRLRILTENDADALVNAATEGALWQLNYTVVPSKDTVDTYIETALKGHSEGTMIPFAIELLENNAVIGTTRFWNIDTKNRSLEIGATWISKPFQRTFVNTEIKYLMLAYAFENLNCIRVQFTTDETNEQSLQAILRLGAKEEGVIRYERIMPNGRKRNSIRFSIIEDEWMSVKDGLIKKMQTR